MSLSTLRNQIDRLDRQLLRLLNRRARLALWAWRLKRKDRRPVFDPKRERTVLRQVLRANRGPLPPEAIARVFAEILRHSRRLERTASRTD